MSRSIEIKIPVILLSLFLIGTVSASSPFYVHQTELIFSNTSGNETFGSLPLSNPKPVWDEQIGTTLAGQNFTALQYTVNAIPQNDINGFGIAYLVNGLTPAGYWYQVGLFWNWPNTDGTYNPGFAMAYEVFNSAGSSVFPIGGGGGLQSFSGNVYPGDMILLKLNFSNGNVIMSANDLNTSANANALYSAQGSSKFIGAPYGGSYISNAQGLFTGTMSEAYHNLTYYGTEKIQNYTNFRFNALSGTMWADEWAPGFGLPTLFSASSSTFIYGNAIQRFYSNGAVEASNANFVSTGSLPLPAPKTSLIAISPNQYFTITANATGGITPYTYNYIIANSISNAIVFSNSVANVMSTTNVVSLNANQIGSGSFYAYVIATDSESPPANLVSRNSTLFTVTPALQSPLLSLSGNAIDLGQSVTINAVIAGGAAPFTYNLMVFNSISGVIVSNALFSSVNALSESLTFNTNSMLLGAFSANVIVTDSSNTPFTLNSVPSNFIVSPSLSVSPIYPSSNILDLGQSFTLASNVFGGTVPYTYNFIVYNGVTGNIIAYSTQNSNALSFTPNAIGIINSKLFVSDSASSPVTSNSQLSSNIIISTVLAVNAITESVNTIFTGQNAIISANTPVTGSSPYLYRWFVLTPGSSTYRNVTASNSILSNFMFATNQLTSTGYYRFRLQVSDSANSVVNSSSVQMLLNFNGIFNVSNTISNTVIYNNGQAKVTLSSNTVNAIIVSLLISNQTGIFPANLPNNVSISVFNITFHPNAVNAIISANFTIAYPCNYSSSLVAPYLFSNGIWAKITPFTVNSASCTITSYVSNDLNIGIFAAIPQTTTTTINSGGGGGGGGAIIGGGGGGGSFLPTVLNILNGYKILNFSEENAELLNFSGSKIRVTENFITPTSAGVSIGNTSLTLMPYQKRPFTAANSSMFIELLNISYLPIIHTIILEVVNQKNTTAPNATGPISNIIVSATYPVNTVINFASGSPVKVLSSGNKTIFTLLSHINQSSKLYISNLTQKVSGPANYSRQILLFNLSISGSNITSNVLSDYPCSLPSGTIAAFKLVNNSWHKLKSAVNSSSCAILFSIPQDPIIGIFSSYFVPPPGPTALKTSSTISMSTTTTVAPQPNPADNDYLIAVITAIILLAVAYVFLRKTRHSSKSDEKSEKTGHEQPKGSE